jgi:hypothetical protein
VAPFKVNARVVLRSLHVVLAAYLFVSGIKLLIGKPDFSDHVTPSHTKYFVFYHFLGSTYGVILDTG